MSEKATLSSTFQISIPQTVRAANGWQAGQEFVFLPKGSSVLLVPVPEIDDLTGLVPDGDTNDVRDRKDRI